MNKQRRKRAISTQFQLATMAFFLVLSLTSMGEQPALQIIKSQVYPWFFSATEKTSNHSGCHFLEEDTSLVLHHGLRYGSAADLIALHERLKLSYLQVKHPDHRDAKPENKGIQCTG
ncbi:MAG: hypothetical protein ACPGSC_04725 [Granulosicoccaceae bacterium]